MTDITGNDSTDSTTEESRRSDTGSRTRTRTRRRARSTETSTSDQPAADATDDVSASRARGDGPAKPTAKRTSHTPRQLV